MAGTSSPINVSAQARKHTAGQKSKQRGTRTRSASSPFASLFATLASFSSSSTSTVAPATGGSSSSIARTPKSLLKSAGEPRGKSASTNQNNVLSKGMPSSRDGRSQALVRRKSTPAKQVITTAKPIPTSQTTPRLARPDVFSFQDGESRAPSPRRRDKKPVKPSSRPSSKPSSRSAGTSVDQEQIYSSPRPIKPVKIPNPDLSIDSESDSGLTESATSSPPDTPSPAETKTIGSYLHAPGLQGPYKDAVGRSIHPEDFYPGRRYGRRPQENIVPPEAPYPPHLQQQFPPPSATLRTPSFDYHSSASNRGLYNPYSEPVMPNNLFLQPGTAAAPNPYPTPPLEHVQTAQNPRLSMQNRRAGPTQVQPSEPSVPLSLNNASASVPPTAIRATARKPVPWKAESDFFPRQYSYLTRHMIQRCESIINELEKDLAYADHTTSGNDGSPAVWHRDQLIMKLSNMVVMHHRLLDTWSKVVSIPRLTSQASLPSTVAKLESIRTQMRKEFEPYKDWKGVDVDGGIAFVVNDLLVIGESVVEGSNSKPEVSDKQALAYLFGAIMMLLVLQDGLAVGPCIAGAVLLGLWRNVQG